MCAGVLFLYTCITFYFVKKTTLKIESFQFSKLLVWRPIWPKNLSVRKRSFYDKGIKMNFHSIPIHYNFLIYLEIIKKFGKINNNYFLNNNENWLSVTTFAKSEEFCSHMLSTRLGISKRCPQSHTGYPFQISNFFEFFSSFMMGVGPREKKVPDFC